MLSYAVVGASRGIGLGFIRKLSSDPANKVFALARNPSKATELIKFVESVDNKHKNVTIIEMDLNDLTSIKNASKQVASATDGTLDVLINNGALLHQERNRLSLSKYPDEETLENDLLAFYKTNVIGVTHTINAFLPLLRAGKTKRILIVTSSMGSPEFARTTQYVEAPCYSISKSALNMVIVKFAAALRDEGFVVLGVSPGLVKTLPGSADIVDKIYGGIVAKLRNYNPNFEGVVSIEDSVERQLSLLHKLTPEESGALIHSNGENFNEVH
ncbi:short-chain dehydrogenases reductase [Pyrrhoderma noxium]|uniref:Short-chain dehydrogenases reductase n=1 Tax=Pyrrhoderma noxium TaxID=2282107 RepID=A0A286U874_9AGAM|nr:short-chain dehydrogenases reductase [Pyrrhoderma noxium]